MTEDHALGLTVPWTSCDFIVIGLVPSERVLCQVTVPAASIDLLVGKFKGFIAWAENWSLLERFAY